MSEVTIEPGPDDTPTVVPTGDQAASVVSTDGQVVIGGLDATGVDEGYVPTADGADGWAWAEVGGGLPDTGPRQVKELINDYNSLFNMATSSLTLQRVGPFVMMVANLRLKPSVTLFNQDLFEPPDGFKPTVDGATFLSSAQWQGWQNGPLGYEVYPDYIYLVAPSGTTTPSSPGAYAAFATGMWLTADPWPTTLPGTPA